MDGEVGVVVSVEMDVEVGELGGRCYGVSNMEECDRVAIGEIIAVFEESFGRLWREGEKKQEEVKIELSQLSIRLETKGEQGMVGGGRLGIVSFILAVEERVTDTP